jgi:F0F1-type ATP synthase gamma subunit
MNIQEIKQKVEEGESLQLITRVFTEISSAKLKRIRKGIEQNRAFFYDLTNIYSLINMLSVKQGIKRKPKNPRTVVILLTSNFRFYGMVTNPLIDYFLKDTGKKDVDKIVIGKTAHANLETLHYNQQYRKMTFNSDIPSMSEIQNLTNQVKDYAKVVVYYSQMKSVLIQVPVSKDITQSIDPLQYVNQEKEVQKLLSEFDYILEPDLGIMLQFFDAQIKGLLLEHTFLESELARTASRLISMDSAQNQAKDYLSDMKNELRIEKKNITNARIIETISVLNLVRNRYKNG